MKVGSNVSHSSERGGEESCELELQLPDVAACPEACYLETTVVHRWHSWVVWDERGEVEDISHSLLK